MTALSSDWEAGRMSASGTFETCQQTPEMSAPGGIAEVGSRGAQDRFDPVRTSARWDPRRKNAYARVENTGDGIGNEATGVHRAT
jgi:hypothetical protein